MRLIAALWNLAPCTVLAGPPGSGRTRLLQRELAAALRGGPHLFVGTGGPGGVRRALEAGRVQLEAGAAPGVLVAVDDLDALLRAPADDSAAGAARVEVLRWLLDPPEGGHLLLTLRDDAWPLLANWHRQLPHLADQTVTLPAPRRPARAARAGWLPAGVAAAAALAALWVAPPRSGADASAPVVQAAVLPLPQVPGAITLPPAGAAPLPPAAPEPTTLLREATARAGLRWVDALAGAAAGDVARVGYHQLRGAAGDGWLIVMPLVAEPLRILAAPGDAAQHWQDAADRPVAGDARAIAAAEAAWRALFGRAPRVDAQDPAALQVVAGAAGAAPGWRVLPAAEDAASTARLRQDFLPAPGGGIAELGYLVVRAPAAGVAAALGTALCDALPALRAAADPAWQRFEPVDALLHPQPWAAEARDALLRCDARSAPRHTAAATIDPAPKGTP